MRLLCKIGALLTISMLLIAPAWGAVSSNPSTLDDGFSIANNGHGPGDGTGNDGDGPSDGTGNGPGDCDKTRMNQIFTAKQNAGSGNNGGYGPGDGTGNDGDGPSDGTGNGPGDC